MSDRTHPVPKHIRDELLDLTNGNAAALFRKLKPECSPTTFYRALNGERVTDGVVDLLRSHHALYTTRLYPDALLRSAVVAARSHLVMLRKGKSVNMEDFERELMLFLQRKAVSDQA